ncbi:MAG: hypothetical protein F4093_04990 [Gammaproteobacteria bacterium]|nr:hypothetical protein [Gammaproteobacteria bacterium]MYJ52009.1 hypothetical protein [Gammaproteobacteria bacterium]
MSRIASWRRVGICVGFPLVMFFLGYSGALEPVGKAFVVFFKFYTEAELIKLSATGFINDDGLAEYVVGLDPDGPDFSGPEFLMAQQGVRSVRDTAFSNWYVIEIEAGMPDRLSALKDLPQIDFVLQNRGLWLCH